MQFRRCAFFTFVGDNRVDLLSTGQSMSHETNGNVEKIPYTLGLQDGLFLSRWSAPLLGLDSSSLVNTVSDRTSFVP